MAGYYPLVLVAVKAALFEKLIGSSR